MAPNGDAYHVDWIFSNNSNVHVANNRDWFTSYTKFASHVGSMYFPEVCMDVIGIGTVELNVRLHKHRRRGKENFKKLVLHNVLHAPSSVCNIFGWPILDEYEVITNFGDRSGYLTDPSTGERAGLITMPRLLRLWLHGQSADQSSLGDDLYLINVQWSNEERARWEAHKPYTPDEKHWLKENFGNEFKFLQTHGLSIYKREDREEGRAIFRDIMKHDDDASDNEASSEEVDDSDDSDHFLSELEDDPMSHLADYAFSESQLRWIKKHHQYSSNFMLSYGLKPYNGDDCEEAKAIITGLMGLDD